MRNGFNVQRVKAGNPCKKQEKDGLKLRIGDDKNFEELGQTKGGG